MDEQIEFDSLDEALERYGIPLENRTFLRRIPPVIPLGRFRRTSGYIRADRSDGGPQLNIGAGYTNGFLSEEEVVEVFGDVERWESHTRGPLWGVSHPVNWLRDGDTGGQDRSAVRDYGTCQTHFMKLSATGECALCDEE